jgi:hypothetical protein
MALRLIGVDPAVAKLCAASFDAAWERAIPHEAYQPA